MKLQNLFTLMFLLMPACEAPEFETSGFQFENGGICSIWELECEDGTACVVYGGVRRCLRRCGVEGQHLEDCCCRRVDDSGEDMYCMPSDFWSCQPEGAAGAAGAAGGPA